jgi:hypothetical protein
MHQLPVHIPWFFATFHWTAMYDHSSVSTDHLQKLQDLDCFSYVGRCIHKLWFPDESTLPDVFSLDS